MHFADTLERIPVASVDAEPVRYVFRLAAIEEQFKQLHPRENFGACWQMVDRHVRQYPGLFSEGVEDELLEGIEITRDASGELVIADVKTEAGLGMIRQTLETMLEQRAEDGNKHVAQRLTGKV